MMHIPSRTIPRLLKSLLRGSSKLKAVADYVASAVTVVRIVSRARCFLIIPLITCLGAKSLIRRIDAAGALEDWLDLCELYHWATWFYR